MKRRGFLGLLAGAAAAPVLPAFGAQELVRYVFHAPLLPVGEIADEPFSAATPAYSGLMTPAAFRAELQKGLNQVFAEEYSKNLPEWQKLFEADPADEPTLYGFAPPP